MIKIREPLERTVDRFSPSRLGYFFALDDVLSENISDLSQKV
jgi:hypothetical protein